MTVSATADAVRVLRIGTFYWQLPTGPQAPRHEFATLARQLAGRLRSDPRVVSVRDPDSDRDTTEYRLETFYPAEAPDLDSILFGSDAMTALFRSFPIAFRVRVPVKNQPIHDGVADIPSDTYTAAWNGVTLVVLWTQNTDHIPLSGGHIVIDVLRDAVEGQPGASLVNQACSANCHFQFMHPAIRLEPVPFDDAEDGVDFRLSEVPGRRHFLVCTSTADDEDDFEHVLGLTYTLIHTADQFATLKSLGRRVISIEETAREELSKAIAIQYEESKNALLPVHERVGKKWTFRQKKRNLRKSVIALWLCIANLETLIRSWEEERRTFIESASEDGQLPFFEIDSKSEDALIQSLRLDHLESAVEQVSQSLNNSAMVAATLGGALAGGLAGGALGALATAIGN